MQQHKHSTNSTLNRLRIRNHPWGNASPVLVLQSYNYPFPTSFASLHPGKVGRVVVYGVANTMQYCKGLWSNNLIDTDREVLNIAIECSQNPDDFTDQLPRVFSLVLARLGKILNQLQTNHTAMPRS